MTLEEAAKQYCISIELSEDGWYWLIDEGYYTASGSKYYQTSEPARIDLIEFLQTFKGFV